MPEVDHLVVGGGMTASAAVMGILAERPEARIAMIAAEGRPPYERPPLSKDLWLDDPADVESITHDAELFGGARIVLGRRVVAIDPATHEATDDAGESWRYRTALLATGATPRVPPFARERDVLLFRTLDDFERLRARAREGRRRVLVVGGGFLGAELAAALRGDGAEVTMAFPERDVGALVLPAPLAATLTRRYAARGVRVLRSTLVEHVEDGTPQRVATDAGETLSVDAIVAAVGVTPNVDLARAAGARIDDGVVVDERFRTSVPDLYAAGDVARVPTPVLGPTRFEHEDAAKSGGLHAGRSMAGAPEPFDHLPYAYGEFFDAGWEAVGRLDPSLEVVLDGGVADGEPGVAYYLDEGRVRGVLTWGLFGRVEEARALVRADLAVDPRDLRGRIAID